MHHPTLTELLGFVDGELGPAKQSSVATHLNDCAHCLSEVERLKMTSAAIAGSSMPEEESGAAKGRQAAALAALLAGMTSARASDKQPRRHWLRSLTYAAALLVLVGSSWMLLSLHGKAPVEARMLPNPALTPGAVRQVSLSEICAASDDEVVRDVPAVMEQAIFREYGLSRARAGEFEVDHLITPGLGGSDDVANLWPQPHGAQWNSYVKDQLEDRLHHMVCRGQLPLDAAQKEIAADWIAAYKRYFHTEEPLRAAGSPAGLCGAESDGPPQRVALLR